MKLIDGKKIAEKIRMEIRTEVAQMIDDEDRAPHLAAVILGEDPASQTYVTGKEKACKSVGITSSVYKLPENTSENELLELIDFLNKDPEVDGFIVQLPLPEHISEEQVLQRIDPSKDVDGFHPMNLGRMVSGLPAYLPATPYGIVQLLERSKIETEGKHCVVLGRSNIVGTPVSILLSRKANPGNCTVTICHSRTKDIEKIAASADILIAAIGQEGFVTADMVKQGAVVIDVGIHRVPSEKTKSGFKLKGDVKFDEVSKKCSYITPVPGGVGPMTITCLLQNTLKAHKKEIYG
ncbi:MAG: bifunctional methylenetetrahydrofolate dehydrogenase/methenyltetrahydrofolate cyclohydrolase FolD [Bacteroidetes bacterium]|nr:MAG: bifunctional methylenetetrahydrofolate dehydrogenase/methenyltetrahydrofolate cyclohydrolase FolD [Bacteroidota bacterium]